MKVKTKAIKKKIDKEYSQKKVLKQFKEAAKKGTLGRGTLAKKFAAELKPLSDVAEGKSVAGELKALFTFDQIFNMFDVSLITRSEARTLLGIEEKFQPAKKEASDVEQTVSEDSSEGQDETNGQYTHTDDSTSNTSAEQTNAG